VTLRLPTSRLRRPAEGAETGRKLVEKPSPKEPRDVRAPMVPLKVGRLRSGDISPAAVILASDAAAMVTGAEYEVTGGDSAKDIRARLAGGREARRRLGRSFNRFPVES
jgi:hypothetical protein